MKRFIIGFLTAFIFAVGFFNWFMWLMGTPNPLPSGYTHFQASLPVGLISALLGGLSLAVRPIKRK